MGVGAESAPVPGVRLESPESIFRLPHIAARVHVQYMIWCSARFLLGLRPLDALVKSSNLNFSAHSEIQYC